MAEETLTEREAKRLLEMLKKLLVDEIMFPNEGGVSKEFEVIGETKADIFSIKIFRGKINHFKIQFWSSYKEKRNNVSRIAYKPE